MKKHSSKIIAAILSAGVIASAMGATLSASAADVKVSMVQNKYCNPMVNNQPTWGYLPVKGTVKSGNYFNQTEYYFYSNTVKAINYFKNLGFNYNNKVTFYTQNGYVNEYSTTVYISHTEDNGKPGSSTYTINGYKDMTNNSNGAFGMIITGPVDYTYMNPIEYSQDVIAHEYVHLITQQVAGWDAAVRSKSIEAGAVVEAYSDILGELTETTPDWQMGTGLYLNNSDKTKCIRSLKNPKGTKKPTSRYTCVTPKAYADYDEYKSDADKEKTEEYFYATSAILSNAAYQMSLTGFKKDVIAELWLDSIALFPDKKNPTLSNCRQALIKSVDQYAKDRNYSSRNKGEMLARVNWAFDQVKVY